LLEQGFEVAVAKDAVAATRHPVWDDGYTAALINFAFLANAVLSTDEVVKAMKQLRNSDRVHQLLERSKTINKKLAGKAALVTGGSRRESKTHHAQVVKELIWLARVLEVRSRGGIV
jgi:hypothetical protein